MEYILQSTELTKSYAGVNVVDHVNLNVRRGDIYGFVGKNGAGKTTFLRLVLGMALPTSGDFVLFGTKNTFEGRKRTGSLVENPALYGNMTAQGNMNIMSDIAGTDPKKNQELLNLVGLGQTGSKKAGNFSLGMRQRLGIAMALVGDPEFIVLDEPMNGLDPTGIVEMRNLILSLNKEHGKTILISSHLLDELSKVATRYGIIRNGKLVEEIGADEVSNKCSDSLVIKTDNPQKAKDLLAKTFKTVNIDILHDGSVYVMGDIENTGILTQTLFENGLSVEGISKESNNFEKYFIDRMEGNKE